MSKPPMMRSHGGLRLTAGRQRKPSTQRRDYGVKASFTKSEYAALKREAQALGICISQLVARKAANN